MPIWLPLDNQGAALEVAKLIRIKRRLQFRIIFKTKYWLLMTWTGKFGCLFRMFLTYRSLWLLFPPYSIFYCLVLALVSQLVWLIRMFPKLSSSLLSCNSSHRGSWLGGSAPFTGGIWFASKLGIWTQWTWGTLPCQSINRTNSDTGIMINKIWVVWEVLTTLTIGKISRCKTNRWATVATWLEKLEMNFWFSIRKLFNFSVEFL